MKYQAAARNHKGKTKLSSADYFSCENSPLFQYHGVDINTKTLDLLPPPELHVLLGLGNDFFDLIVDRLKAKDAKYLDIIKDFLKSHNLLRQVYYTGGRTYFPGQFDGDSCKFFLNLVEKLETCLKNVDGAYEPVAQILTVMML